jgi:hypothetical protein
VLSFAAVAVLSDADPVATGLAGVLGSLFPNAELMVSTAPRAPEPRLTPTRIEGPGPNRECGCRRAVSVRRAHVVCAQLGALGPYRLSVVLFVLLVRPLMVSTRREIRILRVCGDHASYA